VILWTVVVVALVTAVVQVLRGTRWPRSLAGVVVGAISFQVLTLVQPPLVVGVLSTAIAVAMVLPMRLSSSQLGKRTFGVWRWTPDAAISSGREQ
jgi:hypothetical protein